MKLFAQLSTSRAVDEEAFRELTVSAAAIDWLLGDEDPKRKEARRSVGAKRKTMRAVWTKWTQEHHSFSAIELTDEELRPFTSGKRDEFKQEGNIVQSLKYTAPGLERKGQKAKPLSSDEKLLNAIYMKECSKVYEENVLCVSMCRMSVDSRLCSVVVASVLYTYVCNV